MSRFDFIIGESFRNSLEQDYQELYLAMNTKAWKAVHVLSGSIIEAILIDYLVFAEYQNKSVNELLRMDLAEAISACKKENVLSERTEHLSHVIRSYRNLIHPGRSIRLNEIADEGGAKIAAELTEIIIEEVTNRRKQNYGYTGEQIITKMEFDPSSNAILSHLLKDTNKHEIERILLDIIPQKYLESKDNPDHKKILKPLEDCFRLSFQMATRETKERVTSAFARNIREEASDVQWRYIFFRGSDLEYLSLKDRALVKEHLLSIMTRPLATTTLETVQGIGKFLTPEEWRQFTFVFVSSLASQRWAMSSQYENLLTKIFTGEAFELETDVYKQLEDYLVKLYNVNKDKESVKNAIDTLYTKTFLRPSLMSESLGDLEDGSDDALGDLEDNSDNSW